ncbi:hypothetical protein SSCG_05001 [Streptomyces clavuligerus]|nr:hypothetical protein SSCG_05001 [Streptomyces clavuligerus]
MKDLYTRKPGHQHSIIEGSASTVRKISGPIRTVSAPQSPTVPPARAPRRETEADDVRI